MLIHQILMVLLGIEPKEGLAHAGHMLNPFASPVPQEVNVNLYLSIVSLIPAIQCM